MNSDNECRLLFADAGYYYAGYYLPQERAPFFAFSYKTRANTQQVLPLQTGLCRYDE